MDGRLPPDGPQMHQDGSQDLSLPNTRMELTPEDKMTFKECQRESLIYRCLPLQALITGYIAHKHRQGAFVSLSNVKIVGIYLFANMVGLITGRMSYVNECRKKFDRLENSSVKKAIQVAQGNVSKIPVHYDNSKPIEIKTPVVDQKIQKDDWRENLQLYNEDRFSEQQNKSLQKEEEYSTDRFSGRSQTSGAWTLPGKQGNRVDGSKDSWTLPGNRKTNQPWSETQRYPQPNDSHQPGSTKSGHPADNVKYDPDKYVPSFFIEDDKK